MKDLLFKMREEWVKKHLQGRYDGRFCRVPVRQEPELSGEGQRILFSDGERVIGESVISDIRKGEVRFEPLTAVRKPNPVEPPENGFEYVDAEDCGRYSIRFHGVEHGYETLHDVVEAVLDKREEARNSDEVLCHTFWTKVQDLDLNRYEDYSERLDRGTLLGVRDEFQVQRGVYPPTDPEIVVKRYKESARATRIYGSIKGYVETVQEYYREDGREDLAEEIGERVELPDESEDGRSNEMVRERVSKICYSELGRETAAK